MMRHSGPPWPLAGQHRTLHKPPVQAIEAMYPMVERMHQAEVERLKRLGSLNRSKTSMTKIGVEFARSPMCRCVSRIVREIFRSICCL